MAKETKSKWLDTIDMTTIDKRKAFSLRMNVGS